MPGAPMRAEGRTAVRAPPAAVRAAILDPAVLARVIPGAEGVVRGPDGAFIATLALGVGPFRGRQTITLRVEAETADGFAVSGHATGPFGVGRATGHIHHVSDGHGGSLLSWHYDGTIRGPVTLAGPVLLRLSAAAFVGGVFRALRRAVETR